MRLVNQIVSEVAQNRAAEIASIALMPKSTTFRIACRIPGVMYVPPGAPTTKNGSSFLNTIVGAIDDARALPGAIEPDLPGRGSKAPIAPLYMKPRPSVTTPDGVPSVCVSETHI